MCSHRELANVKLAADRFASSSVALVKGGGVRAPRTPSQFGKQRSHAEALAGGDVLVCSLPSSVVLFAVNLVECCWRGGVPLRKLLATLALCIRTSSIFHSAAGILGGLGPNSDATATSDLILAGLARSSQSNFHDAWKSSSRVSWFSLP